MNLLDVISCNKSFPWASVLTVQVFSHCVLVLCLSYNCKNSSGKARKIPLFNTDFFPMYVPELQCGITFMATFFPCGKSPEFLGQIAIVLFLNCDVLLLTADNGRDVENSFMYMCNLDNLATLQIQIPICTNEGIWIWNVARFSKLLKVCL